MRRLIGCVLLLVLSERSAWAQATRIIAGPTLPTLCTVGAVYYKTGSAAGLYVCSAANTWIPTVNGVGVQANVIGPVFSTDKALVRFSGAGGTQLQNSGITVTDGASGTLSGTNTGDQNLFASIPVSGQTTVTASSPTTALTFVAGPNISIATNNTTKTITFTGAAGGSGDVFGPASAVDGDLAVFDGTDGKHIKSGGATSGAPTNATYLTQTANGGLSAEQALSALSSGIMRVATTTGVVTSLGDILPSANGGTANAFFTVSGPTSSAKTFTFPDASATVLTTNALVSVAQGGTGLASITATAIPKGAGTSALAVSGCLIDASNNLGCPGTFTSGVGSGLPGVVETGTVLLTPVAISALPTCNSGAEGSFAAVTDAMVPTYLATIAAGGSAHVPVYCNGTNWIAH